MWYFQRYKTWCTRYVCRKNQRTFLNLIFNCEWGQLCRKNVGVTFTYRKSPITNKYIVSAINVTKTFVSYKSLKFWKKISKHQFLSLGTLDQFLQYTSEWFLNTDNINIFPLQFNINTVTSLNHIKASCDIIFTNEFGLKCTEKL